MGYFIYKNRMTFEEAFEKVREKRPHIDPNIGFVVQLQALAKYWQQYNDEIDENVFDYEDYSKHSGSIS